MARLVKFSAHRPSSAAK